MDDSPYSPPQPDYPNSERDQYAREQYPGAQYPPFKSSPVQAIRSVISSPNWGNNVLWLSIASLTSGFFVGQIGLFGYGTDLLKARAGRPENPKPDIDSNRLGDYISMGIWPFLVQFVAQMVASFVIMIPLMIVVFLFIGVGAAAGGDAGAALAPLLMVPAMMLLTLLVNIITVPFITRAMVTQDFVKAFDFGWAMNYVKIMFSEIAISGFIFGLLAALIGLAGMAFFCVGYIPAIGIVMGAMMHLIAQWYEIYLSRGGEPAPEPESVVDATMV